MIDAATQIIVLLALVLPIHMGYGLVVSMHAWSVASLLNLGIVLHTVYSPFRGCHSQASQYSLRRIVAYCTPLMLSSILSTQMVAGERFVVSRWYGPEQFAIYANGAWVLPIIPIVTSATMSVLLPSFTRMISARGSKEAVLETWRRSIEKTTLFVYPCVAFAFFYADAIVTALFSEKYLASVSIFRVYLAIGVFRVIAFNPMMMAMGYVRSYTIAHLIGCGCVWTSVILLGIAQAPLTWIAAAYVMSMGILVVICLARITSGLGTKLANVIPTRRVLGIAAVSIMLAGSSRIAVRFVPITSTESPIFRLCLGAVIFGLTFLSVARWANMGLGEVIRSSGLLPQR